ncbi:MAG: alpha/beta hydrolase [Bacteroidota bacterium]
MTKTIYYQSYKIQCQIEGQGETLVFLHGWPTHSGLWADQVAAFKQDYRVITFDWLGFGQSDKPLDHTYSFTHKKEILDTVLNALVATDEKINLIAHDVGGPAAMLWAAENPHRVERLILLNTLFYPFSTTLDKASHLGFHLPLLKNALMSHIGLRFVMNTMIRNRSSAMQQKIVDILAAYQSVPAELKLKTILDPLKEGRRNELLDLIDTYQKLAVKRYLIMAKSDPLCYAHIRKASRENPAIPSYVIERCGHFISLERPEALNKVLRGILRA